MRITIVGWCGVGNTGDEAILLSTARAFDALSLKYVVLSFDADETYGLLKNAKGLETVCQLGDKNRIWKTEFVSIIKALRETDLVLLGGGGLLQDAYNWYTIPYYASLALLAKLMGKSTMFYCVGAGPIKYAYSRRLIGIVGGQVDLITVRDKFSKDELIACGVEEDKIVVAADPAFALQPAPVAKAREILVQAGVPVGAGRLIGISVREVAQWIPLSKMKLAELFDEMASRLHASVVFFPVGQYTNQLFGITQTEPTDYETAQKIAGFMKTKAHLLNGGVYTPDELMAAIGKMDCFVGMRLHSLIMAAVMGVPFIAISHRQDAKLEYMLRTLDLEEYDIKVDSLDRREFARITESLWANKIEIQRHLHHKCCELRQKALSAVGLVMACRRTASPKASSIAKFGLTLLLGSAYLFALSLAKRTRIP